MQSEILRNIQVAKPCPVLWSEMEGDERSRYCSHCKLNVHNIAGLTTGEAEKLLGTANGRLCVRYFKRPDGTVMTKDCPAGLAAARRRLALALACAASLLMVSWAFAMQPFAGASGHAHDSGVSWFQRFLDWLSPGEQVQGDIVGAIPVTTSPPPTKGP